MGRGLTTRRTPRRHPADLPAGLLLPAALAAAFLVLPLVAVATEVPWPRFLGLVTSPAALSALALSLGTATASTVICLLLGVPLSLVLARHEFPGRTLLRAVVLLPLVLPPVVGGLALLHTFGRTGLLGAGLELVGIRVAFTTVAVVLAQVFVALPFLVIGLEGALAGRQQAYADVAATLGAGPWTTLRRVTLPLVSPALVAGTVLCFARALGEFGATLTFAGSLQGTTRTLPLEVYLQRETDPAAALALSVVLIVVALTVVLVAHRPYARAGSRA